MPVYTDGDRAGLPRPLSRNAAMEVVFGKAGADRLTTVTLPGINRRASVHQRVASAFVGVFKDIDNAGLTGLVYTYDGTYNYRTVRGSSALSPHSWGVAVDINAARIMRNGKEVNGESNFHCSSAQVPESCRRLAPYFHKWGFSWGGDWSAEYLDPMHYEATDITVALLEGGTCAGMDAWRKRMEADGATRGREWRFTAVRDTNGHITAQGRATTFDDATTRTGYPANAPGMIACSLPRGLCAATEGSPFAPYDIEDLTMVVVWNPATNRQIVAPVIDEGPSWEAKAGTGTPGSAMIDLTPAAASALGMSDNAKVHIRVIQGTEADGRRMLASGGSRETATLLGPDGKAIAGAYREGGTLVAPVRPVVVACGKGITWDAGSATGKIV